MENKFKILESKFDIEEPTIGHFNRFQNKLESNNSSKKKTSFYKYIAIAASLLLLFTIGFSNIQASNGTELADISPKMEETQDYFTSVIHQELEKIELLKNTHNKKIIEDAFTQLQLLENDYNKQTLELQDNNDNKKIIFAMINNFQQRITVLQNLLSNLHDFEQLKNTNNEINNI